jgi:hypothetical protein
MPKSRALHWHTEHETRLYTGVISELMPRDFGSKRISVHKNPIYIQSFVQALIMNDTGTLSLV